MVSVNPGQLAVMATRDAIGAPAGVASAVLLPGPPQILSGGNRPYLWRLKGLRHETLMKETT